MIQNQLSRYGAIGRNVPGLHPSGRVFLVSDSDDTTVGPANLGTEYGVDNKGVVRVYSTIQDAVNACDSRGDIVWVSPYHTENFTRVDCWDKPGVQIIGGGEGDARPALVYNDSSASVRLRANGVKVSNIMFQASTDSIGIAVRMDTGFFGQRLDNCVFNTDAATDNFTTMLYVSSKETVIERNQFLAQDTAGAGSAIKLNFGEPDNLVIRDNYIYGQYDSTNTAGDTKSPSGSVGPIVVDTSDTNDTNLSGIVIERNTIINTDTAVSQMVRLGGGTLLIRGIMKDNYFASYDSATADSTKFVLGIAANSGLRAVNNYVGSADSDPSFEVRVGDSVAALA